MAFHKYRETPFSLFCYYTTSISLSLSVSLSLPTLIFSPFLLVSLSPFLSLNPAFLSLSLSLPTLLFSLSHTLFPSHTHSHSNETPAPVPSTERRLTHFAFVSEFHNQLHTKPQLN